MDDALSLGSVRVDELHILSCEGRQEQPKTAFYCLGGKGLVQLLTCFVLFFLPLKKMSFHLILVPRRIMFQDTVFPHINLLISEERWRMKWFSMNLVHRIFPHVSRIAINEGLILPVQFIYFGIVLFLIMKRNSYTCSDWCTKMYVWMNDPLDTTLGGSYHSRYMALKPVTTAPSRCISYD